MVPTEPQGSGLEKSVESRKTSNSYLDKFSIVPIFDVTGFDMKILCWGPDHYRDERDTRKTVGVLSAPLELKVPGPLRSTLDGKDYECVRGPWDSNMTQVTKDKIHTHIHTHNSLYFEPSSSLVTSSVRSRLDFNSSENKQSPETKLRKRLRKPYRRRTRGSDDEPQSNS